MTTPRPLWLHMRRIGLLTSTLLLGCEAPSSGEVPPEVEIGTGTWRFEPLRDGAKLPLVFGAQGGWHLWVALRVSGITDDTGSLEVTHFSTATPDETTRTSHGIHLDPPNANGFRVYLGWPAILRDPACAVGHPYRLEVAFRPAAGGRLSAHLDVEVAPGDHPPPLCQF